MKKLMVFILLLSAFCLISSYRCTMITYKEISTEVDNIELEVVEEDNSPPEDEILAIARTLYGECRGVASDREKAAVAWVILNRVDAGFGDTVLEVVSAPSQFLGYNPEHPIQEELYDLSEDVLIRWYNEKSGITDSGRILPPDYLWFHGDGEHNHFRNEFESKDTWDWSLENPYED